MNKFYYLTLILNILNIAAVPCVSNDCCTACCAEVSGILGLNLQGCFAGCGLDSCDGNDESCIAGSDFGEGFLHDDQFCCQGDGTVSTIDQTDDCVARSSGGGGPSGGVVFLIVLIFLCGFAGLGFFLYKKYQKYQADNAYLSKGPGGPPGKGTPNKLFKATPSMGESAGPIAGMELEASSHNSSAVGKKGMQHYTKKKQALNKKGTLRKAAELSVKKLQGGAVQVKNNMFKNEEEEKDDHSV